MSSREFKSFLRQTGLVELVEQDLKYYYTFINIEKIDHPDKDYLMHYKRALVYNTGEEEKELFSNYYCLSCSKEEFKKISFGEDKVYRVENASIDDDIVNDAYGCEIGEHSVQHELYDLIVKKYNITDKILKDAAIIRDYDYSIRLLEMDIKKRQDDLEARKYERKERERKFSNEFNVENFKQVKRK